MSALSELRVAVVIRDRICVAALLDQSHQCRDKWGYPQGEMDLPKLTLEHVKVDGIRFDSADHCVAMCSGGNVTEHWSSNPENNRLANAYLAGIRVGRRER